MAIRKVEVDDYSNLNEVDHGKLIVREFAGKICLEILGDNKCQVCWEDLKRAWEAVKQY